MVADDPVHILLVDDHPAKLLSYEVVLRDLGERLLTAGSAKEALAQLLKHDVALVLIDVCMPDLDGFELASMIRDHPRFERIAIIFVSAIALTDLDRLKGYKHGAVDYIPVPVVPDVLRAKVRVFTELYRKTRQLELFNAELESRVAERTAALERANAELESRVEERTREREMALAQVHEMQKLESLGHLTGGVAHDFNNVLMAILGNLEMVGRNLAGDSRNRRLVEGAMRAAERGAGLTRRMLAFARRQELMPEVVDVAKLIDGATPMLRSSLGPGIDIRVEVAPDLAVVRVDPNQLELALLNLALNARDAMPDGGCLTIGAERKALAAGNLHGLDAGAYVSIAVSDTGVGMDEATLARAPEPFFTTKGVGKGTGLGLSSIYGLTAQSGGTTRISSKLGSGTRVEIWLPVASGEQARPATLPRAVAAARPRSCHVLFVDDDTLVTEATMGMLAELGHRTLIATSATAALDTIGREPKIDLVITDHAMPGMTGMELAQRIRKLRPDLPVALATGWAEPGSAAALRIPRLDKPFSLDKLAALIATLLGQPASADHQRPSLQPLKGAHAGVTAYDFDE